jgi:superoxide reductase
MDMQRRNIGATALAGAALAATVALPKRADAGKHSENVVFTAEDPGHWKEVESLHVPVLTVADGVLTVKTPHPMSAPHFIVSHTVVLEGGKFLDRKTFVYTDMPVSTHTLPPGYKGKITVTSTCNLHDFWVEKTTV